MYTLKLLGTPAIEGPGGLVAKGSVPRKRMALLALLASAGETGLSRDKLLGFLWPERSDSEARHLLADSVYRLRRTLGSDALNSDGDVLRLNPRVVHSDLQDFSVARAEEDLEAVVGLYRGPFLDGFHLSGGRSKFEHWMEAERSAIQRETEGALETLAERCEAAGDPVGASGWWHRYLELDPVNSRVAARLMNALVDAGDRGNALQVARDHERLLREELEMEPAAEFRALEEVLKAPRERKSSPGRASSRTAFPAGRSGRDRSGLPWSRSKTRPPARRLPFGFVSREKELARLEIFLKDAIAGRGGVVFITGESGTGKTALAQEFCRRTIQKRADLVVATGNANPYIGTGNPYHVFRDILGLLTGDVEARWAAGSLSGAHAMRLWNLLPVTASALASSGRDLVGTLLHADSLIERLSEFEMGEPLRDLNLVGLFQTSERVPRAPPTQDALLQQYVRVIQAVARVQPLLLVLEDLHWADQGSTALLFQLGRALYGHRVLILGLFRPSEVAIGWQGERHPLASVVNELVRVHGDIEVSLPEEGDRAFLDAVVDAEPNRLERPFRDQLFEHTMGHALFTVELLRSLQEKGGVVRDSQGRWIPGEASVRGTMPPRVEAVIAERIGRLPEELDRALSLASIEGERFTLEVVAELMAMDVDDLLPRVTGELEKRHHLVQSQTFRQTAGQTFSEFRFRHILFQRFLYGRLGPVERSRLHGRVGEVLERFHGGRAGEIALELARHFQEAGLAGRAVQYLCQAGGQAKASAAYPEAVAHYQRGVALLNETPGSLERDGMELSAQMALGTLWQGVKGHGLAEAEEALTRAMELADRLGEDSSRFWILLGQDAIAHYRAQHDRGSMLLEECLRLAEADGDRGLLAVTYALLGMNASNRGRHTDALAHYDRFRSLYDPLQHLPLMSEWVGDPEPYVDGETGLVLWLMGYPERAREKVTDAVRQAHEGGNTITIHLGLLQDVILRMWLHDTHGISRQTGALRELGIEHGMPQIVSWASFHEGWGLAREGREDEGVSVMERSLRELEDQGWAVWYPFMGALLADTYRRRGLEEQGLEVVERGLETVETTGERIHEAEQHRIRGEILWGLERLGEADAAFRRALFVARGQESRAYALRAATSLASLLRETGRRKEGWKILSDVYAGFTEGFDTWDLRMARSVLGQVDPTPGP